MSLAPAYASLLRAGREEFNRRFEQARHRYPRLDSDYFLDFLRGPAEQLVLAVEKADRGAGSGLLDALYDIALALLGQAWIGPAARCQGIVETWQGLAARNPRLLAGDPRRLLAASANALLHFAPDGGGLAWSGTLLQLAEQARDPAELLRAGQLAAWRHGLAHYRDSALEQAGAIDAATLEQVFGLPAGSWQEDWLERLVRDRWFEPGGEQASRPRLVRQLGAFIGYGGCFMAPPLAVAGRDALLLIDGGTLHALHADAYGACLLPAAASPPQAGQAWPKGWRCEGSRLKIGAWELVLEEGGAITSLALLGDVAVLTQALTHTISVLAVPDQGAQ